METCENCKFYHGDNGVCSVPLWIGAELYRGRYAKPEDPACGIFEEAESDDQR